MSDSTIAQLRKIARDIAALQQRIDVVNHEERDQLAEIKAWAASERAAYVRRIEALKAQAAPLAIEELESTPLQRRYVSVPGARFGWHEGRPSVVADDERAAARWLAEHGHVEYVRQPDPELDKVALLAGAHIRENGEACIVTEDGECLPIPGVRVTARSDTFYVSVRPPQQETAA